MAKICFFINNINLTGGTERVTSVIASALKKTGNEVHVLSLQCGYKPFFDLEGDIIISQLQTEQNGRLLRIPLAIYRLREYLKCNDIDVLIDVDTMLSIYSLPASIGLKIRHICWEHFNYNVMLGKSSRIIARKLAAYFADDVVTLTEYDKNLWLSNAKCNAKISVIPNPITISLPEQHMKKQQKLFLAVGRLTYLKGFDLLLRAWAIAARDTSDWRLRIVGSGEEQNNIVHLIRQLGIESNTELLPKTNDVSKHYNEAAFFVLSSRFESFGLVILEALSHGLPVISFDCDSGPREIIKDQLSGHLCQASSVEHLAELIKREINLFDIDYHRYECFSKRAKDDSKNYRVEHIIIEWSNLINSKR